jgi:hypothetical protein
MRSSVSSPIADESSAPFPTYGVVLPTWSPTPNQSQAKHDGTIHPLDECNLRRVSTSPSTTSFTGVSKKKVSRVMD